MRVNLSSKDIDNIRVSLTLRILNLIEAMNEAPDFVKDDYQVLIDELKGIRADLRAQQVYEPSAE